MKKKVFVVSTIVAIAITVFSFAAKSACGRVANSDCYSAENGKYCLHTIIECGNCDGSKVVPELPTY